VRILKDLFAPKWCKIGGASELRILKDLAAKTSERGNKKAAVACRLSMDLYGSDYD
jgi:hypothetical protein